MFTVKVLLPLWGSLHHGLLPYFIIIIPWDSKGLTKGGRWKEALICQKASFCKPEVSMVSNHAFSRPLALYFWSKNDVLSNGCIGVSPLQIMKRAPNQFHVGLRAAQVLAPDRIA